MPTKHPSAWRLNKGEQQAVERDLATWAAGLAGNLSEEEKNRLREDERKRLIRLTQQAKHEQSLQKQSNVGAKNKAKAKAAAGNKASAGQPGADPSLVVDSAGCNSDYYENLKQDLAVISQALGSNLKEMKPAPIAATVNEKSGIQDSVFLIKTTIFHSHIF